MGIKPTPLIVGVSALQVRPLGTISSLIAQQELYAYKFHVLHHRAPSGKSKYEQTSFGKVQFSRCKHAIINVNNHHTSILG